VIDVSRDLTKEDEIRSNQMRTCTIPSIITIALYKQQVRKSKIQTAPKADKEGYNKNSHLLLVRRQNTTTI
jgi:hypothetical protein